MYLNRAEAYVKLGQLEKARADINTIRTRAINDQAAYDATTFAANAAQLVDKERQLELAWEGWRRQDLVRFGKFTSAYSSRPQLPDEARGYTTVFPILEKIRVMNERLKQNPVY